MSQAGAVPQHKYRGWPGLIPLFALLALTFVLHIALGAKFMSPATVLEALFNFDPRNFDHSIIRGLRLTRAILAIAVGASLALAGALMQGVTRNPLADPALLGLTAGASFAVVLATVLIGLGSIFVPMVAVAGALTAAVLVYAIARWIPGGATPLSLTLSGAAISALLGALISLVHILDQDTFDNLRVWLTGSLSGRKLDVLWWTGPWLLLAMAAGVALSRKVTALAMGDDVARALGINTDVLKLQLLAVVVTLTACSVAIAGPLGFVGLVIPHVVRLYVGSDYRWIVPYSALVGALYLLSVDIVARIAIPPQEISTGIITALIGAPLFVVLVRNRAK